MENGSLPAELPEELRRFLRLVEEGRYWESHEVLEGPWRTLDSGFYHGLILYASAFVHWERRNAHGVRAQLRKAHPKLEPFRPAYLGLDVDGILTHVSACREALSPFGEGWSGVKPPRLEVDPARVRGDEPELRRPRGADPAQAP